MKHIYKPKGPYKSGGKTFDCECINSDKPTPKGWFATLEEALKPVKKVKADDNEG